MGQLRNVFGELSSRVTAGSFERAPAVISLSIRFAPFRSPVKETGLTYESKYIDGASVSGCRRFV
jgi:hypothetical protein